MSYSEDYRKITIKYRQDGHTLEETKEIFKVSIARIVAIDTLNISFVSYSVCPSCLYLIVIFL